MQAAASPSSRRASSPRVKSVGAAVAKNGRPVLRCMRCSGSQSSSPARFATGNGSSTRSAGAPTTAPSRSSSVRAFSGSLRCSARPPSVFRRQSGREVIGHRVGAPMLPRRWIGRLGQRAGMSPDEPREVEPGYQSGSRSDPTSEVSVVMSVPSGFAVAIWG
jgi:hypothetical protein